MRRQLWSLDSAKFCEAIAAELIRCVALCLWALGGLDEASTGILG